MNQGIQGLPAKERIVITTQHVRNVETLTSDQNVQLQAQLEGEDPKLRGAVLEPREITKRKEPETALPQRAKITAKSKKSSPKAGRSIIADEDSDRDFEQLPAEDEALNHMRTRNMGSKHVPVSRVSTVLLKDPKSYREAIKDPRVGQWKEAMRTEIESLEHNDTWEGVQKPRDAKLLYSKWVYKLKMHADGTIERYKAKLVARGDEQIYGVDYTYTFSAVVEMVSGKVILAVSRIWGVPARHGDVPSAYVKADKEEDLEILLHIPQGMDIDAE